MIQSDGGGIGVFDIDADGWPDLYFTQGGEWPAAASQTGPEDRIFRNLRGKTFRDMTSATGVVDRGFGQGVTIGDLDCDGFPEVYVANAGGNRLFRNNGDGTLTDISIESGLAGNDWSTSCAIMDFDLNGHPDLYVVNYLSLDDASAEICHEEGKLRSCRPGGFMAADDRLYLNDGDWSFTDVSSTSGILQPDGRGLGIIAADFDGDRFPDIFVGNDAVPNFLFLNRTDFTGSPSVVGESSDAEAHGIPASTGPDGRRVRFEESAVHRGIATDEAGRSQACMGIACADFNHDQQPDIFVTNFYNEPNTLYLGQRGGMFVDRTRSYQLAAPSMSMLGFGTQPLDADLDGDDDLAILNGHIDDLSASGVPYRMKPQFFENQSGKVFTESEVKCRFFLEEHLGRSLARLDWNRDGREDLAAGVLEAPSVLLTNTTNASGSWLGLQLVGTLSARDATGSTVTVQWGEHSVSRQLTSGSGFQASNQNKLTFGIPGPGADPVVNVTVLWPNGQVNSFRNLETDCDYIVVQSQSENSDGRGPVLCTH